MNGPLRGFHRWLVTGASGFIGSHLVETLLGNDQFVVGLDNFVTGRRSNLEDVQRRVKDSQWSRFRLQEGDIRSRSDVDVAMGNADFVLHQAALASVPRSIEDPLETHATNVSGFLNVLMAARDAGVRRVIYASSSAVYGDCTRVPSSEQEVGRPLSPYAMSKCVNEQYAGIFERCYRMTTVGLRYFNVFGPRQDPAGPYAAVIPKWIDALLHDRPVEIFGDGETSRDFCHVDNVVSANLLAATHDLVPDSPQVYNVGLGRATTLNDLHRALRQQSGLLHPQAADAAAVHREFRAGDVRHSCADISRIQRQLGFKPAKDVSTGLAETVRWFAGVEKSLPAR